MPIYEYRCETCGHTSEEMQGIHDAPLTECPRCGGPYKKLISAPAFQFKGSGWYVTDYARKSAKAGGSDSGSEKASSGDGGSGGEGKAGTEKASGDKASGEGSKAAPPKTTSGDD